MAEVTIKFDMAEEAEELSAALNGSKWKAVAWEMDQELRKEIKYNEANSEEVHAAYEHMRETLRYLINSHGLNLE